MNADIKEVLLNERQLDHIIGKLAQKIDKDYEGDDKHLVLVSILKGAVMFTGALMNKIRTPAEVEFMKVSSYNGGVKSTGKLNIFMDLKRDDLDKLDILIVEDVVDSGRTLSVLTKLLSERGAKSVRTCTLLDKPSRREVPFKADYVGMEIPDKFVVGFGLDFDERYRNLPYIGVLEPKVYE